MKGTIATIVLVAVSSAIPIVLGEIILRHFYPIGGSSTFEHRIPHSTFGWVLEPGVSYLNNMPEGTVSVTYNTSGWRDVEHSFKNNRGAFRILVLGDSFMEGYSVELEEMFHRQIERLARKDGIDIEVINLGVGGYGTLQEYLVFQNIGQLYKPDIVLLGFYLGNDVKNNSLSLESINNTNYMKTKSRPFLDPSNEMTWKITEVDNKGAWRRYLAAKTRRESFIQKLKSQSALIKTTLRALRRVKNAIMDTDRTSRKTKNKKGNNLVLYGANYCQEHPEYTKAWVTTKRIIDRLNNDVLKIGAELFVFTVPAQHEVIEEGRDTNPSRKLICWKEMPAYYRLKRILNKLDIGYVDLLPSFKNIMQIDKQNLFRRSDRHWNEKGHHKAATIVYKALKDRRLLPLSLDETNDSAQGVLGIR